MPLPPAPRSESLVRYLCTRSSSWRNTWGSGRREIWDLKRETWDRRFVGTQPPLLRDSVWGVLPIKLQKQKTWQGCHEMVVASSGRPPGQTFQSSGGTQKAKTNLSEYFGSPTGELQNAIRISILGVKCSDNARHSKRGRYEKRLG